MARFLRFDPTDAPLDAPVAERRDLHGHTGCEGTERLRRALERRARARSGCVVHVITGKGRGSAGGTALRRRLLGRPLRGERRRLIADWAPDEDDGGYKVRFG